MPEYGSWEVLIKVEAVGICGSDVHYYREGRIGPYVVEAPIVLGHETSGTVEAVGVDVTRVKVGDRVAVEPGVPCGRCVDCRRGRYNLCARISFHATPPVDGTLQKYIAMPEDFVFRLPSEIDAAIGTFTEPLAVAVWACRKAEISAGSRVIVTGAGTVGILTAQVARSFGATDVVVTDVDPQKLSVASSLGATATCDARSFVEQEPRFDAHIECSGSPVAAVQGMSGLRGLGMSVLVGMGTEEVAVPASLIQGRELRITGVFRYAHCFPLAVDLLTSGRVEVEPLISARFALKDSEKALRASGGPGMLKVIVEV